MSSRSAELHTGHGRLDSSSSGSGFWASHCWASNSATCFRSWTSYVETAVPCWICGSARVQDHCIGVQRGRRGLLTIDAVVDSHGMKGDAADGARVCFLGPRANASIVVDVLASVESGHNIEMTGIIGRTTRGEVLGRRARRLPRRRAVDGRGPRQGLKTYDALLGLSHDADLDKAVEEMKKTCKRNGPQVEEGQYIDGEGRRRRGSGRGVADWILRRWSGMNSDVSVHGSGVTGVFGEHDAGRVARRGYLPSL